ncbi:uncharacterized protein LOC108466416 [Gossypium arboreum]|uniref:uncharacterized protein LOC108466416 n=1 Tax=Gossypium arboreum TaxID=29729 RepID=UPI00081965C0|nr:uncharacterized protein LOC108466416 [Gossypium arboreum]
MDKDLRHMILIEAYNNPYAMHPNGNKMYQDLEPIKKPEWKWEQIMMDFVSRLPLTPSRKDSVWILEDMHQSCAIDFGGNSDGHLPLAKFVYNNNYQRGILMFSFEAVYGRKCRTPLCWFNMEKERNLGADLVHEIKDKAKLFMSG